MPTWAQPTSVALAVDRRKLDPSKRSHEFFLFQGPGHDWGKTYADIEIGPDYSETNSLGVTVADRDPPGGGIPCSICGPRRWAWRSLPTRSSSAATRSSAPSR